MEQISVSTIDPEILISIIKESLILLKTKGFLYVEQITDNKIKEKILTDELLNDEEKCSQILREDLYLYNNNDKYRKINDEFNKKMFEAYKQ